jgi:hypothetical protein
MDLEPINDAIRSAMDTARTNEAKISQSQATLRRAAETLKRMAAHTSQEPESDGDAESGGRPVPAEHSTPSA